MDQSQTRARCRIVPVSEMTVQDALRRWPRICGHVICHSLGYATPTTAASIVLAAAHREKHYCEWIHACYQGDPLPAVRQAIRGRHSHHGYMAEYALARQLVQRAIAHGDPCTFASWF